MAYSNPGVYPGVPTGSTVSALNPLWWGDTPPPHSQELGTRGDPTYPKNLLRIGGQGLSSSVGAWGNREVRGLGGSGLRAGGEFPAAAARLHPRSHAAPMRTTGSHSHLGTWGHCITPGPGPCPPEGSSETWAVTHTQRLNLQASAGRALSSQQILSPSLALHSAHGLSSFQF